MTSKVPKKVRFSISSFPHDDRLWRVDWFGGLRFNELNPEESQIEVFLSPFNSEYMDKPAANKAVFENERKSIYVGIGQLLLIHVGSIWKNGLPIEDHKLRKYKYTSEIFKNLRISREHVKICSAGQKSEDDYIIPPAYYSIGSHSGLKAKCLCIEKDEDPYNIIIPMVEVIRFYYAQSSKIAKVLFNGSYGQNESIIYDPEYTIENIEEGCHQIKLRKEFSNSDAWFAARLAFSEVARKNAKRIWASIIKSRDKNNIAFPATHPPFYDKTDLKVFGKYIPKKISDVKKEWRFLVLWIQSCSGPFPYDNDLALIRDNPADIIESDDDRLPIGYPQSIDTVGPAGVKNGYISDNEPASNLIKEDYVDVMKDRFPFLKGKRIWKILKESNEYVSINNPQYEIVGNEALFSTGGKNYSNTDITPFNIRINENTSEDEQLNKNKRRKALHASFQNFYNGILALAKRGDVEYKFIPAPQQYRVSLDSFIDDEQDIIGQEIPLSYLGQVRVKRGERRKVLVVELVTNEYHFYLAEIEPHPVMKEYQMLFTYMENFQKLSEMHLNLIFRHCEMNEGKWFREGDIPFLFRSHFRHSSHSSGAFATKIIKKINKAFKSAT